MGSRYIAFLSHLLFTISIHTRAHTHRKSGEQHTRGLCHETYGGSVIEVWRRVVCSVCGDKNEFYGPEVLRPLDCDGDADGYVCEC